MLNATEVPQQLDPGSHGVPFNFHGRRNVFPAIMNDAPKRWDVYSMASHRPTLATTNASDTEGVVLVQEAFELGAFNATGDQGASC